MSASFPNMRGKGRHMRIIVKVGINLNHGKSLGLKFSSKKTISDCWLVTMNMKKYAG